ncbi:MAG: proton-conducting transporter transmembrane domain-containing protein [Armatimonadota bacterium]
MRHRVSLGLIWSALALLLASMAGVVLAANVLTFLVAWEVMALSSFALVAADHEQRSVRRAAIVYLGATRIGTALLMCGFLWVHHLTGSWVFADWHLSGMTALGPALLLFIGLATKAGSWPFHLWLPIAHPAAPAPVSALMSGVMIKTAIYMMARLFLVGDHLSTPALGPLLLALGAISALWGVLFALLQHDLKRLLAYHSVENIGIILMGFGVSLLGAQWGIPLLVPLGLAAALFHTLNHAVFKCLLFLGAGAIDAQTHLRNIELIGGLIHRMPWTAGAFIVGSAAICALPPLNGFASEWLLYRGFFDLALQAPTVGMRMGGLLLMGWLALVGALAIACFVKAVGVVFLGQPRSARAEHAQEAGKGMVVAQVLLAALCVGLGLAVPALLGPLGHISALPQSVILLTQAWTIPVGLLAVILLVTVGALAVWRSLLGRKRPVRRFITWECGFGDLSPRAQYTATSFAQPISRLFGAIYRYTNEVSIHGRHRRHFPEQVAAETVYEPYLETRLYAPLLSGFRRVAGIFLMRLQAGSIHQYLIYMALVLGLLLWVGCR